MHTGTVRSSDIFASSDNPTKRLDVPFLLLLAHLRGEPEAIGSEALDLLGRALGADGMRALTRQLAFAVSVADAQTAILRALRIKQPSDALKSGAYALARFALTQEAARLSAEAARLQQRAGILERALRNA